MTVTVSSNSKSNQNDVGSIEAANSYEEYDKTCRQFVNTLAIAVFCAILFSITFLFWAHSQPTEFKSNLKSRNFQQINSDEYSKFNSNATNINELLKIVSREEWGARPPQGELTKLELPSTRVIIAHTASENCTTQAVCANRIQMIQIFHMESKGWDDIAYSFLVGGDGAVYVGRGWDFQGAHTRGYNVKSISIAFIGTFNKYEPPTAQLDAAQKIIQEGVRLGKLSDTYDLYGQRQIISVESPGLALYNIIKKWKHWTDLDE